MKCKSNRPNRLACTSVIPQLPRSEVGHINVTVQRAQTQDKKATASPHDGVDVMGSHSSEGPHESQRSSRSLILSDNAHDLSESRLWRRARAGRCDV